MAEVGPETSPQSSPFHIEAMILAYEEVTTSEKRLKARFLKDVKVKERDSKRPMVERPVWPYEYWRTNYTDFDDLEASSTRDFNPQTRRRVPLNVTSESQASQKGDWDHFSLPETRQNEVNPVTYEANTAKAESTAEHSSEGMNNAIQRAINVLSDLQDLTSVFLKIYSEAGEKDLTVKEGEKTQVTLAEGNPDISKPEVMDEHQQRELAKGNDQFPGITPDNTLSFNLKSNSNTFEGSEEQRTNSPTEESNTQSKEIVAKDLTLKNTSFPGECEVPLAEEESETEQSSEGGDTKEDLGTLDCLNKDTCINVEMRSEETLVETKIGLKGKRADDSKERQPTIVESEQDTRDRYINKTLECSKEISTPEIPHFKSELQVPVSQHSVLHNFIQKWLPRISIDEATSQYIRHLVRSLMDKTILQLQEACPIFSNCYIIETGSMAEGTKIGHPDEFDFTVALPVLADPDMAELLYIKLGIQARLHEQMSDKVFRDTLRKHLPMGWEMLQESNMHMMRVFLKNQTLTIHLQCTSGPHSGFILSIDVCFGIPLNTERLQTVLVGDGFHAVHLSHVQSDCMRLNTGVVAVISRNPLVGARLFYETEPYRFHCNNLAVDCYKLSKHVANMFLPKIKKNNCSLCEDTLIPSFYMKTAVVFMMDVYTEENDWSGVQLGNRLIEIFEILYRCFLHQYLAYYSYPNNGLQQEQAMIYNPTNGSLKVGIGLDDDKPCAIPCLEDLNFATSHRDTTIAVKNYWRYMQSEEWTVCDLLHKLTEILYVFKFTE
ncbi:hypothetical protein AWC38_SpisGene7052 [Stylophora pistillata]|uniref:Mab-21-like HhH/H2TH-like domain-containing protein n=1 Tax=Stylophora pistillata TaxID=50429 RepID=A0A2B4SGN9_STYPI|nr:hypothetical protein AWC38_SpisGene7052 [Stylophora pistillata]